MTITEGEAGGEDHVMEGEVVEEVVGIIVDLIILKVMVRNLS